ncbi:MAG: ABC transporter ATP-binding protein [Firmicutes bacterium]|jgi:simple sugar transport system ATP-binding protein|nr:ABC transporter ATP-binding protein [Bacillota bacterium]
MSEPHDSPVLAMVGITKQFPGVLANDNVSLSLERGEIHALLGENGAGKTTLMKILYGLYQADSGTIMIRGREVSIREPNDALRLGIGMVHQHFMLIPPFTVAENLVLGAEPRTRGFLLDRREADRRVREISERYGLSIDAKAKIMNISVGMQQRVEILKALLRGADILVLDEPTAVLTPQEVHELFEIMRNLKAVGKSIIFITHKLKEVMQISDRVTVIRRGRVVGTRQTAETDTRELANMMVGRDVELVVTKGPAKPGAEILRVEDVHALSSRHLPAVRGVSLSVRAGEILGIAGVDGNGQSELVEVITGMRRAVSGHVSIKGREVTNLPPRKVFESKAVHIPEDRHRHGLILDFTVAENLVLQTYYKPPFSRGLGLSWDAIKSEARRLIAEFDVRTPDEDVLAKSLSGGNQQKVIVARELSRDPELIIAAQPTRGLDVGAIEFVHRRLVEARDAGKAVLLVSLELDEILALADRIAVMYEGEIVGVMDAKDATEEQIGLMMAGALVHGQAQVAGR